MEKTKAIKGRLEQAILALSDEWLLIVEIELETDTYTILHDNLGELGINLAEKGCYSRLNCRVQELVAEEYQKERTLFCSLDNLRDNLLEHSRIECEYVVSVGQNIWRRDIFQVLERDGDKPVRLVWFHINIEQRKLEELKQRQLVQEAQMLSEQAYAIKNMYLDRISTELQTPMNVIIGNAAVARAFSTNSDRVEECLQQISESAKTMFQMVRQIVKMDAIEEGNVVLKMRDVSILEVWKTTLDMLIPMLRARRHKLNAENMSIRHSYVRGDAAMMRQIIMNLLQNAIDYTPVGGQITVSVKETQIDSRFGLYEFCVEDNGVGMTEEFRKVMFQPFAREHSMRVGHVQGLGLGLVIVNNLVRLMNGDIRVDSASGKGTKITVSIKMEYGDESGRLQTREGWDNRNLQSDYAGKRVLLVDDNDLTAGVESKMLTTTGMEVFHALNGEDAVRMFEDSPEGYYDLIVMDLGLPGIDGYAATMGIRQLNREDGKKIPVVAMTTRTYTDRLNMGEQEMLYHITKPVNSHELMEVLRKIL